MFVKTHTSAIDTLYMPVKERSRPMIKIKALWKFRQKESRQELAARSKLTPSTTFDDLTLSQRKTFASLLRYVGRFFGYS